MRLHRDARTLVSGLEAVAAQAAYVQQHIVQTVIRDDKAKSFGHVEPLNYAGNLDDARRVADETVDRVGLQSKTCTWPFGLNCIRRHEEVRRRCIRRLLSRALRELLVKG